MVSPFSVLLCSLSYWSLLGTLPLQIVAGASSSHPGKPGRREPRRSGKPRLGPSKSKRFKTNNNNNEKHTKSLRPWGDLWTALLGFPRLLVVEETLPTAVIWAGEYKIVIYQLCVPRGRGRLFIFEMLSWPLLVMKDQNTGWSTREVGDLLCKVNGWKFIDLTWHARWQRGRRARIWAGGCPRDSERQEGTRTAGQARSEEGWAGRASPRCER